MEAASSTHVPLVRYGKYIRGILGDKYARKTAHSGNVHSVEDPRRAAAFPRFDSDKEPTPVDEKWMTRTRDFLKGVKESFVNDEYDDYIVEDTEREKTSILHQDGLAVRTSQLRDVDYTDSESYYSGICATTLECKARPDIYTHVGEDVVVILDRNGEVVLVYFSRLFQRLFGDAMMQKVDLVLRKLTTIAALPQPDSARHMADELIHQKHPELNMELATTLQELKERAMHRGDLCFPQLGIKLDYQPGACVVFRGAELEHFVDDWTGHRIFLLFTNHQVVRDYSERSEHAGPTSHGDVGTEESDSDGSDSDGSDDSYDICVEKELDSEPEREGRSWTDKEIHGPFTWDPEKNFKPLVS
ncbi:hypothetical protein DL766_001486 [Monosporascus sp. MC13-8B]|uniref:Uncharacterized protein n=1 Tax=Monosporascus cannonballus TaxID=155416 RepID=A0ABY0H2J9_9PEZI|nr:hypothetical protein DL762_006266 [Monosporascus cannonballus]RYO99823.1 hypothetical protein DL763_001213 [Monosporascus cannonballus]RYP37492.1 hypothetical protein DL766_001486 [Monosporascus sp. MC13-8B]